MNEEEILKECTELAENEHHELGDCWDEEYSSSAIFGLIMLYKQTKKQLNSLKEIEKSHKEENGLLREEIIRLDNVLKAKKQEIAYLKIQIPSDRIFYFSDKDYISKDKLKFILSKLNISDIEPWSTYKIDGQILFDLQELL